MTRVVERNETIEKLRSLIEDINFCMLTTVDDDGTLRSRPMSVAGEIEADGTLWFFTDANSHKVVEVSHQAHVNVSFTAFDREHYVSLAGMAELVSDRAKIQQLWQPELQTWFPDGLDTPDLALLKVTVQQAEYWEAASGWMAQLTNFA